VLLPGSAVASFILVCVCACTNAGLSFTTFVNTVPISADKTVNRFALVRNLAWDSTGMFNAGAWDAWARKYVLSNYVYARFFASLLMVGQPALCGRSLSTDIAQSTEKATDFVLISSCDDAVGSVYLV
jgi:hypothetical protein